eukprot:126740-Prymnesium_polylepis.1
MSASSGADACTVSKADSIECSAVRSVIGCATAITSAWSPTPSALTSEGAARGGAAAVGSAAVFSGKPSSRPSSSRES